MGFDRTVKLGEWALWLSKSGTFVAGTFGLFIAMGFLPVVVGAIVANLLGYKNFAEYLIVFGFGGWIAIRNGAIRVHRLLDRPQSTLAKGCALTGRPRAQFVICVTRYKVLAAMLPSTPEEKQAVIDYMKWQAPDLTVEFLQKVYGENILSHQHVVWDVHTNVDRWWVITNPTNLYSQEQFPNMDLAVTFHVGLCLRVPRGQKAKLSELSIEPLAACFRHVSEASDALSSAQEVTDFQAVGVRCREALLAFTSATQVVLPWAGDDASRPKQADFKAWVDHICSVSLAGQTHEHRRHLLKTLLDEAWRFSNWLTHAKASTWYDAEAATTTVEHALGMAASLVIRHVRAVPEACPACGSNRLSPQRGFHSSAPDIEWERPTCDKCGWLGDPVPILGDPKAYAPDDEEHPPPEGDCVFQTVPLRELRKPKRKD